MSLFLTCSVPTVRSKLIAVVLRFGAVAPVLGSTPHTESRPWFSVSKNRPTSTHPEVSPAATGMSPHVPALTGSGEHEQAPTPQTPYLPQALDLFSPPPVGREPQAQPDLRTVRLVFASMPVTGRVRCG